MSVWQSSPLGRHDDVLAVLAVGAVDGAHGTLGAQRLGLRLGPGTVLGSQAVLEEEEDEDAEQQDGHGGVVTHGTLQESYYWRATLGAEFRD